MNVLLTGFEPFAGRAENLSWEVARRVAVLPEFEGVVRAVRLPVSFGRVASVLEAAIEQNMPDVVLMLGFSAMRTEVNVERVALNIKDARITDNDGCRPVDEPIVEGGENALFSTLPIKKMLRAISDAGVEAKVSNSAGTYVCNTAFYTALDYVRRMGVDVKVGFVHLPEMEVGDAERAVRAVIDKLCFITTLKHLIDTQYLKHNEEIIYCNQPVVAVGRGDGTGGRGSNQC